jgi:hypothetical protein
LHPPSIDARRAARVAARLQFLEEDPLEFWDFGMIFAFDVIAQKLQKIAGVNQIVTVNTVAKLLAEEREAVVSRELHNFITATKKPANAPCLAWAARLAAERSIANRSRKPVKKSIRQARSVARAAG